MLGVERAVHGTRVVAVEDFAFGLRKNAAAAARQFGAWTAVICALEHVGLPVIQFTPQEVRKRMSGIGYPSLIGSVKKMAKLDVWRTCVQRLGGTLWLGTAEHEDEGMADSDGRPMTEHEADAACIALAAVSPPTDIVRAVLK